MRRAPPGTLELLLNLTNRHVHAQLVDRGLGSIVLGVHTTEPVSSAASKTSRQPTRSPKSQMRSLTITYFSEQGIRRAIATAENSHIDGYATASVKAAATVGQIFADRAAQRGIHTVFWKAPGKYHGKIKAFIDAVRGKGIKTLRPNPRGTPPVPEIKN